MTLKTALVFLSDAQPGALFAVECLPHDGKTWLVTYWNEAPSEGWKVPARIVMLDNLPHMAMPAGAQEEFMVQVGLPQALFEGVPWTGSAQFVVSEDPPQVRIPIPRGIH